MGLRTQSLVNQEELLCTMLYDVVFLLSDWIEDIFC